MIAELFFNTPLCDTIYFAIAVGGVVIGCIYCFNSQEP